MSAADKPGRRCVCKHLRSHEMYFSDRPLDQSMFHSGVFWCEQTHNGVGPDGVAADIEECSPVRECFEE